MAESRHLTAIRLKAGKARHVSCCIPEGLRTEKGVAGLSCQSGKNLISALALPGSLSLDTEFPSQSRRQKSIRNKTSQVGRLPVDKKHFFARAT